MADHETARAGVTIIDPLGGSIVEALDSRTHRLERWNLSDQDWMRWGAGSRQREELAGPGRFLKQHGYRLVPVEPRTERVKLHRVIGRRLACKPDKIAYAVQVTGAYPTVEVSSNGLAVPPLDATREEAAEWYYSKERVSLVLGNDGEVEVLCRPESGYRLSILAEQDHVAEGLRNDWNALVRGRPFEPVPQREADRVELVPCANAIGRYLSGMSFAAGPVASVIHLDDRRKVRVILASGRECIRFLRDGGTLKVVREEYAP